MFPTPAFFNAYKSFHKIELCQNFPFSSFSSSPTLLFLLKNNEVTRKGKSFFFTDDVDANLFSPENTTPAQKQTIILQIMWNSRQVRKYSATLGQKPTFYPEIPLIAIVQKCEF